MRWNPYHTVPKRRRALLIAGSLLGLLAFWSVLSLGLYPPGSVGMNKLPPPWEVAEGLWVMASSGMLLPAIGGSMLRIAAAATVVALVGVPLGIAMGGSPTLDILFGTPLYPLRSAPIVAIMPLMIVWLGSGDLMKVGFLSLGAVVYLIPMTADAIKNVPRRYWVATHDANGSDFEAVFKTLVPLAAPRILDAIITSISVTWTYITVAEYVTAESGLGRLMSLAVRQSTPQVIGLILLILFIAWVTDTVLRAVRKQVFDFEV